MKNGFVKLIGICLFGLVATGLVAAGLMAPAMAQAQQSCASYTTTINAQVAVTRQSFVISGDGYVTNYYTGWNGNCWSPAQDAFVFKALGNGPFTYTITIFDPQNLGITFTDGNGTGCSNNTAPNAGNAIVFGQIDSRGRVGQLSPWPIPNLPPKEQGEYSAFTLSADRKHLSFVDRDNAGPDYHFGVYLCDPSANTTTHVQVFLSDPGQQPKGTTQPIR